MRVISALGFSLFAATLALTGCGPLGGGEASLCLAVAHPAERELPRNVRTLAVMQFTGATPGDRPHALMASDLLAAKLNETLGSMGQNRCRIVERNNMKDLLRELDLGDAGITDPATAAKAGKMLNADAVIFGSVQVIGRDERGSKTEPSFDVRSQRMTTKTVATVRRTVQVSMNFKMCQPETAELLMSKSSVQNYDSGMVSEQSDLLGGGGRGSLMAVDEAVRTLAGKCVAEFYNMISPHVECHMLALASGKTQQAKAAAAIAQSGDYAEAAKAFEEATTASPEDDAVIYNLGVVRMFLNDGPAAKDCLDKAMRMKADKKYIRARGLLVKAMQSGGNVQLRPANEQEKAECVREGKLSAKKPSLLGR